MINFMKLLYDGEKVEIRKEFLENMVSYCLKTAYHKMMIDAEDQLADFNLTVPQFSILAVVSLNPGITLATLVENLYVTRSTGSEMVEKMVSRKMIVRQPINRKSNGLVLTEEGEKLFSKAHDRVMIKEREFTSQLSDGEVSMLNNLLLKLAP